ncbi:hypothetical protein [Candidatus Methylomirabilis sp.]|uniref:hypothetical protein n=1 Tax=Candidatus Methylomirabilis sp. TaxID=2032687 RepID=UPI003076550A
MWRTVHPHQKAAAMAFSPGPLLNVRVELLPSAKVKVPHAEVGAIGYLNGLLQRRQERLLDIVEYSRH